MKTFPNGRVIIKSSDPEWRTVVNAWMVLQIEKPYKSRIRYFKTQYALHGNSTKVGAGWRSVIFADKEHATLFMLEWS